MNPYRTERQCTVGSAIGIALVILAIVAGVAAIFVFPQILESIVWILIVIAAVIMVIGLGLALISGLMVLPMYAKKGVEYQTDMSYSIDDVNGVDGKMEKE